MGAVGNRNHAHLLDDSFVLLGVLVDQMLVDELWSLEELRTNRTTKRDVFKYRCFREPWRHGHRVVVFWLVPSTVVPTTRMRPGLSNVFFSPIKACHLAARNVSTLFRCSRTTRRAT